MLTVTITELSARADEHARNVEDADRYGWMRAEARRARRSKLRGFSAFAALVRGRPADRGVRIGTVNAVPAQGPAPRGAV